MRRCRFLTRAFSFITSLMLGLAVLPVAAPSLPSQPNAARGCTNPGTEAATVGQALASADAADSPASMPGLGDLDAFITQVMKDWKAPGLAVVVVQDGKVILSKGYGYRDIEKKLPVTSKTVFAIASITKSFTVTLLGMLADEGKLDWDKPLREYLPSFRLYDSVATERVTARDLVTHRTGLPRHDLVWYSSGFARADMVERLRYLEPSKDLRSTYQYNNLMFTTAGYLAEQLTGMTWEDAVRQKVLAPLGMQGTNFSVLDSQKSPDFARPYKNVKEQLKEVPFHNVDQLGPAGGINSNIDDMGQYLLLHLRRGKHDGKQLLSENNAVQMQTPQMVVQSAPRFKELAENSYGMGFVISAYRGHKLVQHGGALDGFAASLAFLPQHNLGVVVLCNLDPERDPLPTIVTYNVFDRLLGLDQIPWNQRFLEQDRKKKDGEEEAKRQGITPRRSGTHPSHDLKEYVGDYENPGYGIVRIEPDGDSFKASLNRLTSPLNHFHYDVFEVPEDPLDPLEKTKIMFLTNLQGDIDSLSLSVDPNVKDVVFTRMPERQMFERSFLEPFTGQYDLPGRSLTVTFKGERTLVLVDPGQPERELVPVRGTAFDYRGLNGFRIEFRKDASGKVTEAVFYQPGSTFVGRKK